SHELVDMIRRYFRGEPLDQHPDINNTEFLEQYGLFKCDGKVCERAIEILDGVPLKKEAYDKKRDN
ncbi:MAG: hypothetical protein ACXQTG_06605, partial [Methanoculleaceae archaeon]